MSYHPHSYTVSLLEEILDYLEPRMDADGGPDGYTPNEEMRLHTRVQEELDRLKRPSDEVTILRTTIANLHAEIRRLQARPVSTATGCEPTKEGK